jgi:hypothetical protein
MADVDANKEITTQKISPYLFRATSHMLTADICQPIRVYQAR